MHLETPRLHIRSFCESDIPAYAEIVSDPAVVKYLGSGSPHTCGEAQTYIADVMRRERMSGISRYAVTRKLERDLVGFCGYKDFGDYVDFGWRYAKRAWGQRYGTEAALAVLNYGIETLRLTNMAACTALENEASLRIIAKLGFLSFERTNVEGRPAIRWYQRGDSQRNRAEFGCGANRASRNNTE